MGVFGSHASSHTTVMSEIYLNRWNVTHQLMHFQYINILV